MGKRKEGIMIREKLKKILMLCIYFISSIFSHSMIIKPLNFGETINHEKVGYKEYKIINNNEFKIMYKVDIKGLNSNDFSVEIYPKVFRLEPKESRIVKVLIQSKEHVNEGEYQFEMLFFPIKLPIKDNIKQGIIGELGTVIGIDMFCYVGQVGDITKDIKIEKVDKIENKIKFDVVNNMDRSIKLSLRTLEKNEIKEEFNFIKRIPKKTRKKVELKLNYFKVDKVEIYDIESEKMLYEKILE
jgi:hypothetical protein